MYAEFLRGPGAVTIVTAQGLDDHVLLVFSTRSHTIHGLGLSRDRQRQVPGLDLLAVAHDEGMLDGIFQFAYVAGEGVFPQGGDRLRGEAVDRFARFPLEFP